MRAANAALSAAGLDPHDDETAATVREALSVAFAAQRAAEERYAHYRREKAQAQTRAREEQVQVVLCEVERKLADDDEDGVFRTVVGVSR